MLESRPLAEKAHIPKGVGETQGTEKAHKLFQRKLFGPPQKRVPPKLFLGDFGGQKRGPKRAIFGYKKLSLLFFFLPLESAGKSAAKKRTAGGTAKSSARGRSVWKSRDTALLPAASHECSFSRHSSQHPALHFCRSWDRGREPCEGPEQSAGKTAEKQLENTHEACKTTVFSWLPRLGTLFGCFPAVFKAWRRGPLY